MTQVPESISRNVERYAAYFDDYERLRMEDAPLWVHQLRKNAIRRFSELGFPITRELEFPAREDWLYTNVAPIGKTVFQATLEAEGPPVPAEALAPYTFGQPGWSRLVFVNGVYAEGLSRVQPLPAGVIVEGLGRALAEHPARVQPHLARYADYRQNGFTALNTAFIRDGAFIHVPEGRMVETPIHILYVAASGETPSVAHPRTLIVLGNGSAVTVVESYIGLSEQTYFTNAVTEIAAGRDASVDHYRINRENRQAYHISTTHLYQQHNSHVSTFNLSMGGALTRNDTNAHLDGEHVTARLNGLYLATGQQHVDNHTAIHHARPNCDSYEVYKGILEGKSQAVFNGKVFVHQDAQETDAKQLNKNLMLSPDATVHTKPQLEIRADQVKCTHGATVGQLDEEQIFYLRTRGLSRDAACHLLTYGFAADLIRRLKVEALREHLDTLFETTIQQLAMAQSQV